MTDFKKIEENLKNEAKRLLESGEVTVVLAYGKGFDEKHPMPYAAISIADVDNIVFNEYCNYNMARYLVRYPQGTKIAIAVKAADSRAVIQLIQEEKVKKENLVLLGIPVIGMKNPKTDEVIDSKTTCGMHNPVLYDVFTGEEVHGQKIVSPYDVLAEYEAMDKDARWKFWKEQLDKCIRCYACRKACPMCTVIPALLISSSQNGQIRRRNLPVILCIT